MKHTLPVVAIIGRPNVGKSTLFNSFLGERRSIVSEISGTTRDSLMEEITDLGKVPFWLVDTAGLSDFGDNTLENEIQLQVEISMANADLILWVVDGNNPLTSDDYKIADKLRKGKTPVVFLANKIDDGNSEKTYELAELGFGLPATISAKNNFGFWEFTEQLQEELKDLGFTAPKKNKVNFEERENPLGEKEVVLEDGEEPEEDAKPISVAFIGRPNVGKSSLLNAFLGKNRAVVSDVAGTTRDSIDEEFTDEDGQKYTFIDTAGVRRPGKIERNFEFWSTVRTSRSIERADICILLIDALDGVTHQDLALAGRVIEAGKGLILGVNKLDLMMEKSHEKDETDERDFDDVQMWGEKIEDIREKYMHYLTQKIKFAPWAPAIFFSAKTKKGMKEILPAIKGIAAERRKRIPTAELNLFVPEVYFAHVIPMSGHKKGKIKYASQVDSNPPKILFFVNNIAAFHWSYGRYLENKLREKYGFFGTPIIVEFRDAMGDRAKKGKK